MNNVASEKSVPQSSGVAVACQGLERSFDEAGRVLTVLQNVDLNVAAGESVAIVGQSGSGKSTLLQILGGLDQPTSGRVELAGHDLFALSDKARTRLRNESLGFVYQFHHLLPEFSAEENVAMPLAMAGMNWSQALHVAREQLAVVELAQRVAHRPAELSGGERQRVAIARALVHQPACVLADEPTGNLDQRTGQHVFDQLLRRQKEQNAALIVVTHDRSLAQQADRCLELSAGQLQVANLNPSSVR